MLCMRWYCGSLRGAWRTTGSKGSDNSECLSLQVYGFLEMKCVLIM